VRAVAEHRVRLGNISAESRMLLAPSPPAPDMSSGALSRRRAVRALGAAAAAAAGVLTVGDALGSSGRTNRA
jgi:hypothetical protein